MTELALRAGLAFAAGLVLVPATRGLALHLGIVARPHASRWHRRPTPLLGGAAIAAIVLAGSLSVTLDAGVLLMLGCAAMMAGLGLVDDIISLKSSTKLVFQIVVASVLVYAGHRLEWTESLTLDTILTLVWIVGITNALNLLDNMDGLAAGVGMIACVSLLMTGDSGASTAEAQLLAMLLGALAAFLVYNLHPASIFMGDAGSLFTGLLLAAASMTEAQAPAPRELLAVVAAPVMVLVIPIFDTTLVVIARLLSGRRPSEGGRDHSSHRMVAMGLSEPAAVGVLWALAAVGGVIGVGVPLLQAEWAGLVAGAFVIAMTLFAAYLTGVRVHRDGTVRQTPGLTPVVVDFMYKRRVLEVLLDLVLVAAAYYTAYRLRFDQAGFEGAFTVFLQSLPVTIACQILVLLTLGAYRGMWRYFSLMDAVVFAQSVALGTVTSGAVLTLLHGSLPMPAAVLVIHAAMLVIFLTGSRASFRLLTEFFRRRGRRLRAVLVAPEPASDLAAHRLVLEQADYRMVGFFVDRPEEGPGSFEGHPVLGDYTTLLKFVAAGLTDVVIVHQGDGRNEELADHCAANGIAVVTLRYAFEPVEARAGTTPSVVGPDLTPSGVRR